MLKWLTMAAAAVLLTGGVVQAQLFDITNPGDPLVGVPNDNNWPAAETPPNAIDNVVTVKYLCFETSFVDIYGNSDPANGGAGLRVTPSGPKVVIKALNFASANDAAERDPVAFRLSGSDEGINGPYTLIAEGTIGDFDQTTAWPRNSWISAPIPINNRKAYAHYELFFTDIRDRTPANSMQIGEVELLSDGSLPGTAGDPVPIDGATDVLRNTLLAWEPGEMAATHNVYLGTSFADVNEAGVSDPRGVLVSQGQTDAQYQPADLLEYGRTYYWRIDEVNAAPDHTVFKGDVWSFTVEPFAYPIPNVTATASSSQTGMGPENAVNGSGLNDLGQHSTNPLDMWMSAGVAPNWIQFEFGKVYKLYEMQVWNSNQMIEAFLGFGAKDVTVEYSEDGETWTTLEGVSEFAQAPGDATYTANTIVDFGGAMAKYVKVAIDSNWGVTAQIGLSEVRFLYVPVQAYQSLPADAATDVVLNSEFTWRPGREATSHEVLFGADPAAMAASTVTDPSFTPSGMDFATTYYWKVNEIGDTGTYEGDLWSFVSQEFAAIDDFESYTDDEGGRIYESWIDGLTNGLSGSQVGYDQSPFAERSIVHGGKQSMPLAYDNTVSPFYSEAELEFAPARNWTTAGADSLCLWARGDAAASPTDLYLTVQDSAGKTATATNGALVTAADWTQWKIPMADLAGVNFAKVAKLTVGVGNKAAPTAGAAGMVFIDDIGYGRSAAQ